jgi:hypothetical protein
MNDTTQQLWRTEFDKQYTKELLTMLHKQTTALVKRYQQRTPLRGSDLGTMDRINTAVLKLHEGSRVWDPERVDLGNFLLGVISSDLTTELRRAKRFPMVSLDDEPTTEPEDDYTGEPIMDTRAASLSNTESGQVLFALPEHQSLDGVWNIAMPHLREGAAKDRDVLALLAAYEEGVYHRRDVMRLLGWNGNKYQRVYRRLLHIASKADEQVRDLIAETFAN